MSPEQRLDSPFRPVAPQPDLPALEREILEMWQERRTFERLRAQNAGNPRWSFLDGPITANNPMGVHHAWGRTYKDVYQRFRAMLGHDQRWQNGFDCQGLWVEVNVERELGFKSKRDIESFGLAEFVSYCKQRVLTYAALQTEQSIRLGMWMDWNDPGELRRLRDLLAQDPLQQITVQGPAGPVTDSVEMIVGRLGMPDLGGSYFTFSNENNDLIWGFLAECHRRGWLYKGHDSMPWCSRCGTGISQMEMNEGYDEREDPGLTVRLPLLDRPGEWLLVWTTTPWTLAANVAAAVGADLSYVKIRQAGDHYWVAKGSLKTAVQGPFEIVGELAGRDLVGWRYGGPFDELPAVQAAFESAGEERAFEHRVVAWDEVGEDEGTGIVHIAPGCGAEDYQLGKALGLPVVAPLDESGHYLRGFDWLSGLDAHGAAARIVEDLQQRGYYYHLEPYRHRYPHCWRCGTPLLFRVVDEWYISMGPLYDVPRSELTSEQIEASLRYQIMEAVDQVRWIPGFGYERELDWLHTMSDWMISKKRYYGLALPIWECAACGAFEVIGGRDELQQRAVEGWAAFEGHTPHRPHVDAVKIRCSACGELSERIRDVGNPWLDAGIVPFSTMHYRTDPDYWSRWFPADFITESFPGQFRNWFYSLLAMSTVLRREPPFRTILGFGLLFGVDGRPMSKSWGNSIEFNEAADRIGVDVIRWMFAKARPEDNIHFGYGTADEARRELLVLWNIYSFFGTYARLSAWRPGADAPAPARDHVLDRWILSRTAGMAADTRRSLEEYDARRAALRLGQHIDELSTWYLRRSRRRFSRSDDAVDRGQAFGVLHAALVGVARTLAPILPFFSERLYQDLVVATDDSALDSVHLTRWPDEELADRRDERLEKAMSTLLRVVELTRTLRGQAGLRLRQPLARLWLAMPTGSLGSGDEDVEAALLDLLADEVNVKQVILIGDESELVERKVKPLLPIIGPRLGAAIPAVMAAARAGDVEYLADGGVRLGGVDLAANEVEILASPRPGTVVAHDDGLLVVLDTQLDDDLRAEGDARELLRGVQDLRKQAGLALDGLVDLWLHAPEEVLAPLRPHLDRVAQDTLAAEIHHASPPRELPTASHPVSNGAVQLAIRARANGRPA